MATPHPQEVDQELEEDIGEIDIAEYVVFLMALDTYTRYVEEHTGEGATDALIKRGVILIRMADRRHIVAIRAFLGENLKSPSQQKSINKAFKFLPTSEGLSRRSLQMRRVLSRGGAATMRAVFKSNRALQEIKAAMAAAAVDDADAALDKFAVISMRNPRLRKWIDDAAASAGSGTFQDPVSAGSNEAVADVQQLFETKVQQQSAPPASEQAKEMGERHDDELLNVQTKATEAASRAMNVSGEPDVPPTKSEVVGIAAAAVAAALSNPKVRKNVPAPLEGLDEEQLDAALTDGKVLVAAGAGAGKSTTLVARIDYLVKDKKANPSRILACSFNKKAADELKGKIAKKLGGQDSVNVGTMHSLFYRFIVGDKHVPGFGTPEEQAMLKPPRLIAPPKKGAKTVSPTSLSTTIRNLWTSCDADALASRWGFPLEWVEEPPKAKKAALLLNKWRGNDVGLEAAKKTVTSKAEAQAVIWYELYLGLKGDIPGWRPPCSSGSYDRFMNKNRPGGERLGDLDDMLQVFKRILVRDEKARQRVQGMFDHILVDECVHEDTLLTVEGKGAVRVADLEIDSPVLSYVNGGRTFRRVTAKKQSRHTKGVRILTAQGFELDMTHEHRVYASSPQIAAQGRAYLYVMHRKDLGFRIGVSERPTRRNPGGSISRACAERADALWVVAEGTLSEMLYLEQAYSLEFSIPTHVFEGLIRGCDQERINRIFAQYGANGQRLLDAKGLKFDYPNWVNDTSSTDRIQRCTINVNAHRGGAGSAGTSVTMSWTGEQLHVGERYVYKTKSGRSMFNRRLTSYAEAKRVALELAANTGGRIRESICVGGEDCFLVPAASVYPGMCIPVSTPGGVVLDRVEEIVESSGVYFDISVDESANFFGNGVLSHNCQDLNLVQHQIFEMITEHIGDGEDGKSLWMIGDDKQAIYQFRGARPELFTSLNGKPGWKTRMIKTNYRCEAEIVDAANRLVAHNDGNIPMEARANPAKERGKASIVVETPEDNTEAAINTIGSVVKDIALEGAKAEEYAVLARTNAELNDFETACIINEIPYVRRGGKGFLEAPESKAVLGYIDLVSGSNYEKMRESLIAVLMKPDRNLFMGPDDVGKAVDEALDDVARRNRVDIKAVNPAMLLDRQNVRNLADRLKQPWKIKITASARGDYRKGEWMYAKKVDELAKNLNQLSGHLRDLSDFINSGEHDTNALLNHILDMPSDVDNWERDRGAFVDTKTLRQQITNDTAIFSDDDDESDAEEESTVEVGEDGQLVDPKKKLDVEDQGKGLGAVKFLYELAKPNDNDMSNNTDPTTAKGFVDKISRYSKLAETLRIDPDKWEREQSKIGSHAKPPAITLSTVHGVKGLEWKNVSVLMPKGKFPPERKPREDEPPPDPIEEAEKIKAERNLAYVALTRAAVNLTVVCPEKSDGKPAGMSRFVFEAGLAPGENVVKDGQVIEKQAAVAETPDPYIQDLVEQYAVGASFSTYDRRQS